MTAHGGEIRLAGLMPRAALAQTAQSPPGTQLVLLGTKGGPTPSPDRAAPANVLIVDGRPCVVACGNGVAIQLTKAGVRLATLDHVFVTHHHSDHNADLGNLVLLAGPRGCARRSISTGRPRSRGCSTRSWR